MHIPISNSCESDHDIRLYLFESSESESSKSESGLVEIKVGMGNVEMRE